MRMFNRGHQKLSNDLDIIQILKTLRELKIVMNFIKNKHSDVMIDLNQSKHHIINLENDDWEWEESNAREAVYMVKKDPTSEDLDVDDISDENSETSKSHPKSKDSGKDSSSSSSSSERSESEDDNTISDIAASQEKSQPKKIAEDFNEDFDDISESNENKQEIMTNKAGPISFDRKNDNQT